MKVLVADDDVDIRRLLSRVLVGWGYEPVMASDGAEALEIMRAPDAPQLLVLDLMMPGIDGLEVCRRVRAERAIGPVYIIILTALDDMRNTVEGFKTGADDYIVKPFVPAELKVRIEAGRRIVELQSALSGKVAELQGVVDHVKGLHGILPVCAYCNSVRDESETWKRFDEYLTEQMAVELSHGICPDCAAEHFPQFTKSVKEKKSAAD
ncbi:MAG: response regulator [Proteobacteria bacterium]|nr:response regulator [Pseudomonadota bacterium]